MILDADGNAQNLKIPKEIYLRILGKAVAQTQNDIRDMESALPVADMEKLQSISHRWKGDYANMRINSLSSLAKILNDEIKICCDQGKMEDKEKIFGLLVQFKNGFSQLENELAGLVNL